MHDFMQHIRPKAYRHPKAYRRTHTSFLIITVSLLLAGCGGNTSLGSSNTLYEQGYRDGVAAGYALLCGGELARTAATNSDHPRYQTGYEEGFVVGQEKCHGAQSRP